MASHARDTRETRETRETTTAEHRVNAARGYKAALHNPHVSEEAKDHARKMLKELEEEEARQKLHGEHHKDPTRVAAGLRAAEHNPLVSEEGKHRAAEKLHQMGRDRPGE